MKEYSLLRAPRQLKPDKKLLPKYPKRVRHPKYYKQKMRQLKRGML